jgi:hypothetical protein
VRASVTGAFLAVLFAACASAPVYLTDLEGQVYTDVNAVLDDLDCTEGIMVSHIGEGATNEQDVIESARDEVRRNIGAEVEQAEQRGQHIWLLATGSDRVLGALDTRGGMAFCE